MIVLENAPEVIAFIEGKLNIKISQPAQAFGYVNDKKEPIAGIVVNDFSGANCELTIVAEKGRMTREVLHHIANHVFNKLGCRRATIRTRKSNKVALRAAERFGFVYEHVAKHFYHDADAVVFRMLRGECRWIT